MLPRIIILSAVLLSGPLIAAPVGIISAEEWARPRSGEALTQMPGLKTAVTAYLSDSGHTLIIHHPVEEEGLLWAEELKTWLVALGIVADDLRLVPTAMDADQLEIHLGSLD